MQIVCPEKNSLSIITIGMTPESFRQAVYAETEKLPSVFSSICEKKRPEFKNFSFPVTPQGQWVLNQILHPALFSARRKVFFEAKALELIDFILESLPRLNQPTTCKDCKEGSRISLIRGCKYKII